LSLKDKRVHSSFVGLPPRPRSLCGLDQMTNCLVFDWYSILIIKYCSFKDGDYMRSCLPFVRFVIHAALVIHGKIYAVRYQCPYFLYAWFYFFWLHMCTVCLIWGPWMAPHWMLCVSFWCTIRKPTVLWPFPSESICMEDWWFYSCPRFREIKGTEVYL